MALYTQNVRFLYADGSSQFYRISMDWLGRFRIRDSQPPAKLKPGNCVLISDSQLPFRRAFSAAAAGRLPAGKLKLLANDLFPFAGQTEGEVCFGHHQQQGQLFFFDEESLTTLAQPENPAAYKAVLVSDPQPDAILQSFIHWQKQPKTYSLYHKSQRLKPMHAYLLSLGGICTLLAAVTAFSAVELYHEYQAQNHTYSRSISSKAVRLNQTNTFNRHAQALLEISQQHFQPNSLGAQILLQQLLQNVPQGTRITRISHDDPQLLSFEGWGQTPDHWLPANQLTVEETSAGKDSTFFKASLSVTVTQPE
ncbi:hypothetical protein [Aliamphritea hakodatensis]|uniref:hypothetical protein n=1 Tax=Aliamphritea hakodatensis TaxID=2895352 RepID=UPI0022FD59B9|nr:hypothetical protein [Aliamphritea hakodatensis]